MFGGEYTRVDTTADAALDSVLSHLRVQLDLNQDTCFETLSPLSAPFNPLSGDFFVTVSPGDGRFVEGEQVEGNVSEDFNVIITGYVRIATDQLENDKQRLHDDTRGLLTVKHKLLKALCGQDIPLTEDTYFLRNPIYVFGCTAPERGVIGDTNTLIAWISLSFGLDFDWDIS